MSRTTLIACLILFAVVVAAAQRANPPVPAARIPEVIHVDPARGNDRFPGSEERPKQTLSGAIALLPDPLPRTVTIKLSPGTYATTGTHDMPAETLVLMRRMPPGVSVYITGTATDPGKPSVLAWEGGEPMIDAREGDWRLQNIQIGSGSLRQRRGVMVAGPAVVTLENVTFRTRSLSDAGIYAHRGGTVLLRGAIRLNEHLHDQAPDESFSGIIATDHGLVRFAAREGASLDMGNGSLSASYYGCIRLGCATARITNWSEHSNLLAINNSGRIDLHNTRLTLNARKHQNTPIGLEHDGHTLGEGAHVTIESDNDMAIALQKASTFTCNDIELHGKYRHCIWASSGSMFVGRFLTDLGGLKATTGANINVEKIAGRFVGPALAEHCGTISLPDRNVFSE
jgi:hypothetical protein